MSASRDRLVDDRPLERVGSHAEVGPGRFWATQAGRGLWIGDDPGGPQDRGRARAEGDAFAERVVVSGFIEKFANPASADAVHTDGAGWRIERNGAPTTAPASTRRAGGCSPATSTTTGR